MNNKIINHDLFGNPIIDDSEDVYKVQNQPKDLSDRIKTQYIIEIVCKNEKDQEKVYNELNEKYTCRVLTL